MTSNLKWDHNQAMSAKSSVDSANSSISGDSVNSPSGCGWSAADASAVVSNLQAALSGLKSSIPSLSTSLSNADSTMTSADTHSASTVPQCSPAQSGTDPGTTLGTSSSLKGSGKPHSSSSPAMSADAGSTWGGSSSGGGGTTSGSHSGTPYAGMSSNPNGR